MARQPSEGDGCVTTYKRKEGEVILIGDDIKIVVIKVKGDVAHIAIEAPKGVQVDREEIRKSRCQAS